MKEIKEFRSTDELMSKRFLEITIEMRGARGSINHLTQTRSLSTTDRQSLETFALGSALHTSNKHQEYSFQQSDPFCHKSSHCPLLAERRRILDVHAEDERIENSEQTNSHPFAHIDEAGAHVQESRAARVVYLWEKERCVDEVLLHTRQGVDDVKPQ